jgi:TATA-binding protein-associated factor Taf7
MIKVIEPGPHATNRTLEWWNHPRLDDTYREQAVAAALDLPAEIVEIVADSDEEVDLASVWIVTEDHERAIGHVTTDPDGTIVVEILYDGYLVVEYA